MIAEVRSGAPLCFFLFLFQKIILDLTAFNNIFNECNNLVRPVENKRNIVNICHRRNRSDMSFKNI